MKVFTVDGKLDEASRTMDQKTVDLPLPKMQQTPVIIETIKKGYSTRKTLILVVSVTCLALILAFFMTEFVISRRHRQQRHRFVNTWPNWDSSSLHYPSTERDHINSFHTIESTGKNALNSDNKAKEHNRVNSWKNVEKSETEEDKSGDTNEKSVEFDSEKSSEKFAEQEDDSKSKTEIEDSVLSPENKLFILRQIVGRIQEMARQRQKFLMESHKLATDNSDNDNGQSQGFHMAFVQVHPTVESFENPPSPGFPMDFPARNMENLQNNFFQKTVDSFPAGQIPVQIEPPQDMIMLPQFLDNSVYENYPAKTGQFYPPRQPFPFYPNQQKPPINFYSNFPPPPLVFGGGGGGAVEDSSGAKKNWPPRVRIVQNFARDNAGRPDSVITEFFGPDVGRMFHRMVRRLNEKQSRIEVEKELEPNPNPNSIQPAGTFFNPQPQQPLGNQIMPNQMERLMIGGPENVNNDADFWNAPPRFQNGPAIFDNRWEMTENNGQQQNRMEQKIAVEPISVPFWRGNNFPPVLDPAANQDPRLNFGQENQLHNQPPPEINPNTAFGPPTNPNLVVPSSERDQSHHQHNHNHGGQQLEQEQQFQAVPEMRQTEQQFPAPILGVINDRIPENEGTLMWQSDVNRDANGQQWVDVEYTEN